ncbi:MAG: CapA family protein [Acidimicrobiia bacterium]
MSSLTVFLSGDVMTGRGIDQIMRHPGDPALYEPWARSALDYVDLAVRRNGPVPRAVPPEYVWGEALDALDSAGAGVRIINLETAVTDRGRPWPGKGIHYRMSPANLGVIDVARIDCCVLANNHVLDWSYEGFSQTLESLHRHGLATGGAGEDVVGATKPAVIEHPPGTRVLVFSLGMASSGVPDSWAAGEGKPGVAFAGSASNGVADTVIARVVEAARPGDLVVVSIHWGQNWGYELPASHGDFAHRLIDSGAVHIVHGHSSHHPLGIEIHRGRLILYGCGDLINDYEGIAGHEEYRPDLGFLYLATMEPSSGSLESLSLIPMRMRRFRLERAPVEDVEWLTRTANRQCRPLSVGIVDQGQGQLRATW